jgi:hypothetical protein
MPKRERRKFADLMGMWRECFAKMVNNAGDFLTLSPALRRLEVRPCGETPREGHEDVLLILAENRDIIALSSFLVLPCC